MGRRLVLGPGLIPASTLMLFCLPVHQDDKEYVGFATLPNQVHRKSVKKGFDFTLMVAGRAVAGQGWAAGVSGRDCFHVGRACGQGRREQQVAVPFCKTAWSHG